MILKIYHINIIKNYFSVLKAIGEKKYDEAFKGQLLIFQNIVKYLQSYDNENWMVPLANTVIIFLFYVLFMYTADMTFFG